MTRSKGCLVAFIAVLTAGCGANEPPRILVFSKTVEYRHESIVAGHALLRQLAAENGFEVDSTEDASSFTANNLENYQAVVFLLTTGDVLDDTQQAALQGYIRGGGGYAGVHSAADTEHDWPWYGGLVGGFFDGHPADPNVRTGVLWVEDPYHASTNHLPERWVRTDEWYDFRERNPDIKVLISIDETSYRDEVREEHHPLAWYHRYDGGRAFYTALGHTSETHSEPRFARHLLGGLQYAMGVADRIPGPPPETEFKKEILLDNLNEPMELDELPDGRIIFAQRHGEVLLVDPDDFSVDTAGVIPVDDSAEDGLLGLAVDPGFASNNWIYLFYSRTDTALQYISRFDLNGNEVDLGSEVLILSIALERGCCHSGGSLEFDPAGNLFISVGDNTNPFQSDGRAPIDERPGQEHWNAQRSAANMIDLRGKILRIRPEPDGSYSIPVGNLFPPDGSAGRPEIYTMGNRNPFRISIDSDTGYLYWGDVGPDANEDDSLRGPRGYDELNQAREAGNYGWPYFIADNKPYRAYDFATGRSGQLFDATGPVNESRLNTGGRDLPPARPAIIWYPYLASEEFPVLGEGGRTSMAGPVYRYRRFADAPFRFPEFYDGKLFVYDWMRYWIKTVTFDESGEVLRIEDFVPATPFTRPMDMIFARDGSLYILEYGTKWASPNPDALLSRVRYGNP